MTSLTLAQPAPKPAKDFVHFSFDSISVPLPKNGRLSLGRWAPKNYHPHFDWSPTFKCLPIGLNLPFLPKLGFNLYLIG